MENIVINKLNMSRKQFKKVKKKMHRKMRRRAAAKARDDLEKEGIIYVVNNVEN